MGETNSPSVAHMVTIFLHSRELNCGYNLKFNSREWRNIATHGQLKENLYLFNLKALVGWDIGFF